MKTYMDVNELTRDQIEQLKCHYLCQKQENVSYGEMAEVDSIISDEEIFEEYGGTAFVPDDFC